MQQRRTRSSHTLWPRLVALVTDMETTLMDFKDARVREKIKGVKTEMQYTCLYKHAIHCIDGA